MRYINPRYLLTYLHWQTPTLRCAAVCSTVGQQRPEKLDRRWLKDGYRVGPQALMTKRRRRRASKADDWWISSAMYSCLV